MNDVILTLDQTSNKTLRTFLDLKERYADAMTSLQVLEEKVQMLTVDTKLIYQSTGNSEFRSYSENQLKAAREYIRRCRRVSADFTDNSEKGMQLIRQVRIQIAMIRSQLKHQYDIISEPGVMNMVSENIKTIAKLVNSVSQKVGNYQSDILIASELITKVQDIVNVLSQLAEDMRT